MSAGVTGAWLMVLVLMLGTPARGQVPIARPTPELEQLLADLAGATNPDMARRTEQLISQLWLKSGGPAVALLLAKATRALQAGQAMEAVADLDAALVLEPDLIEGFALRAEARFEAGDYNGAVRDIQQALQREPRHFGVWRSLSRFAEARGDLAGALAAWRKLLEIDPQTSEAQARLLELTRKVEGQAL